MKKTENLYEAILIFTPTLTPGEAQAELDGISDKVKSRGIAVQQTVAPFKKKLPYTVRHFSNGYFSAVTFTAEKDPMQIVHILKNSKNILRISIGRNSKDIAQSPLFASSTTGTAHASQSTEQAASAQKTTHTTNTPSTLAASAEIAGAEKLADDALSSSEPLTKPTEEQPSTHTEHAEPEKAENKEETLKKIDEELDKILQGVK